MNVNCRVAKTPEELAKALEIRRRVFVNEQQLFVLTDKDEMDETSIHLIAEDSDGIIGTVRIYSEESYVWVGGRLAVLPGKRGIVGSMLIRAAVSEVIRQGANQFFANIQSQNVPLFKRLGWKIAGAEFLHHYRPHYLMEANLFLNNEVL